MTERNREQRTDDGQLQKEICSARWTAWGDDEGERGATASANGGMETKLSRLAALFSVTIRF